MFFAVFAVCGLAGGGLGVAYVVSGAPSLAPGIADLPEARLVLALYAVASLVAAAGILARAPWGLRSYGIFLAYAFLLLPSYVSLRLGRWDTGAVGIDVAFALSSWATGG